MSKKDENFYLIYYNAKKPCAPEIFQSSEIMINEDINRYVERHLNYNLKDFVVIDITNMKKYCSAKVKKQELYEIKFDKEDNV